MNTAGILKNVNRPIDLENPERPVPVAYKTMPKRKEREPASVPVYISDSDEELDLNALPPGVFGNPINVMD